MKNVAKQAASALSALALLSMGAWAADLGKIDPAKPLQAAVDTKASKGKGKVKITGDDTKNSTAPAAKKRAGPFSCDVHIDNRTNWVVHRVVIDGRNWGSVGRYGDAIARDVVSGATTLYAEADFTDGSSRSWGPRTFQCKSYATHTWRLH